jgi:hypothetical protein
MRRLRWAQQTLTLGYTIGAGLEMHLVSTGAGLSITSEAVGLWYKRPGVTFVPIRDLPPCSVALAWWPQDTGLVAELAAVANEVRARIAQT